MAAWSDVVTVLENMTQVVSLRLPVPGMRKYDVVFDINGAGAEVDMVVHSANNENWVEFLSPVDDPNCPDEVTWLEAAESFSSGLPAAGLCAMEGQIWVRHSVYLPGSDIHSISNGLLVAASAGYAAITVPLRR